MTGIKNVAIHQMAPETDKISNMRNRLAENLDKESKCFTKEALAKMKDKIREQCSKYALSWVLVEGNGGGLYQNGKNVVKDPVSAAVLSVRKLLMPDLKSQTEASEKRSPLSQVKLLESDS